MGGVPLDFHDRIQRGTNLHQQNVTPAKKKTINPKKVLPRLDFLKVVGKNIPPNGGLMVIYHDRIRKKSP